MNSAWFDKFFTYLTNEKRFSNHTLQAYQRDLNDFQTFCEENALSSLKNVSVHSARQYLSYCHQRKLSGKSIQRRLSALRSFFRFLIREKYVTANPLDAVKAPKNPQHLPKVIDIDQVQTLLKIDGNDPLIVRDIAILELFYACGLRLSELVSLNMIDLDMTAKMLRVKGKGNKERLLPIGQYALTALNNWFALRKNWTNHDDQAVFISRRGTRISPRNIQARLQQWGVKQGLNSNLHPHRLRHSFASHLLESSGDVRAVQELLGHENLSSTQIYTHLDFQYLASAYDQAHPRAKKHSKKQ